MRFTLASYNILADAYIRPEYYPLVEPQRLDPAWRRPRVLDRIVQLDADVLCLQEVEAGMFDEIESTLKPLGYEAHFAQKHGGKPDGCATFFRESLFELRSGFALNFQDSRTGQPVSGHLALILVLEHETHRLGVINTHLRWDQPDTPRESRWAIAQADEIVQHRRAVGSACEAWLLCGDLNASWGSDVLEVFSGAGFDDAYRTQETAWTCNAHAEAKRIDFVLHSPEFTAEPFDLPTIDGKTPLPSDAEPSDHLPIKARLSIEGTP